MMRVVVDTNILLRAIIKPAGTVAPVLNGFIERHFTLVYSPFILGELLEKLQLPRIRLKYALDEAELGRVVTLIVQLGERFESERAVNVCRDPDDNHVIETALAGNAQFVVTGDEDLLVLEQFETIRFVTPRNFLRLLENEPDAGERPSLSL